MDKVHVLRNSYSYKKVTILFVDRNSFYSGLLESSEMVTGPELTSEIFIIAPKRPVPIALPRVASAF